MKLTVLVAALLLVGGAAAQADTNYFTNMLKHPRSDDVLHADTAYCDEQTGGNYNGAPSAAYLRCMRGRGWRFDHTRATPWIDPETGLRCHSILGGFGSECSNF